MDMKHLLLLPLLLLGTVSALHLENHALSVDSQESQADLSQDLEGSGEQKGELSLTKEAIQPEGEELEPCRYSNDLEDVDDGDDEETTESDPSDLDEDVQCPREEDVVEMVGGSECKSCRYKLVRIPRTFRGAQITCRQCFNGNLVSIHSYKRNCRIRQLIHVIRKSSVWIGGKILRPCRRQDQKIKVRWTDGSSWNFKYWAGGHLGHRGGHCVSIGTRGGHWRRARCQKRLPFICAC